jgi:hypothetical protein
MRLSLPFPSRTIPLTSPQTSDEILPIILAPEYRHFLNASPTTWGKVPGAWSLLSLGMIGQIELD